MKKKLLFSSTIILIVLSVIIFKIYTNDNVADENINQEEKLPPAKDALNVKNGKYVLAFSEANETRENKGSFFVINKDGTYLSRSKELDISDPIAFKQQGNEAYLVNNSSNKRYSVNLASGEIKNIEAKKQNEGQSFTLNANEEYVIYDVANDYNKNQQLVYWNPKTPEDKKIMTIPNGFAQSIYVYNDVAYITTSNPDAIEYVHQVNLKTGKLVNSKKLKLKSEEYTQNGLPSNQSIVMFNKKLYVAVTKTTVIPATENYESDVYEFAGRLIQLNPKTLEIEKKIAINDKDFNPDTLAVVNDQLIVLDTYKQAYSMDKNNKLSMMKFSLNQEMKNELEKIDTMTEQVTIKDEKAYIFTQYVQNEKNRGEINEYDLKDGNHLSRTIISYPTKNYYLMTFSVLN